MDIKGLRKKIKKLLIDQELDKVGNMTKFAKEIGVRKQSLSMALTGYRSGPGSYAILERLYNHLLKSGVVLK